MLILFVLLLGFLLLRPGFLLFSERGSAAEAAPILLALGVGRGDCLCVLMKNCLELIDANAAAVKIGAVIATINFRLDAGAVEAGDGQAVDHHADPRSAGMDMDPVPVSRSEDRVNG